MRLNEITKAEFVDGLKDPAMAELKKMNKEIKSSFNAEDLRYHLKAFEHPDLGTRRKAYVTWDWHDTPLGIHRRKVTMMAHIASYYKNELENWTLKGWEAAGEKADYELVEK